MRNGKLRIVIGIILVLLQIIAVLGLEETNIALYATMSNPPAEPASTEMNLNMWLHGFYTGHRKQRYVFEELPEALSTEGLYFHVSSSEEFLSVRFRDALTAGGHFFQLILYDLNLWLGFYLMGILGAILFISGFFAWRRKKVADDTGYIDLLDSKLAAKFRIPAAIGCWLSVLWQFPITPPILPEYFLPVASSACLAVYFTFYYGKKPSVLPAAGLLFWGVTLLCDGLFAYFPCIGADTQTQLLFYGLTFLLYTPAGILYLLCGRKLLKANTKKSMKWLFTIAGAAELVFAIYHLYQFRSFPWLLLRRASDYLPTIIFLALMGLYIWLVKDGVVEKEIPVAQREPVPEGACPMCRAPLNPGKTVCSRCGTARPMAPVEIELPTEIPTEVPTEVPAEMPVEETPAEEPSTKPEQIARYCHQCGNPVEVGHRFCFHCGTPVWQTTPKE